MRIADALFNANSSLCEGVYSLKCHDLTFKEREREICNLQIVNQIVHRNC